MPVDVRYDTTGISPSVPPSDTPTEFSGDATPRVAVVVDDLGWQKEMATYYDEIKQPLTMAVLPSRPYSLELYERWEDKFEFIVHMPMEPEDYPRNDPGRSALMTSMSNEAIRDQLKTVLRKYPKVRGLNNHMGSEFTATSSSMRSVMSVLEERSMYYLDSRTSSESVAYSVGRSLGVPVLSNDVFLDHADRDYGSVRRQFERLVRIAREEGRSIGIGHFQSEATARVLRNMMSRYADRGIQFVTLGEIVRGTNAK